MSRPPVGHLATVLGCAKATAHLRKVLRLAAQVEREHEAWATRMSGQTDDAAAREAYRVLAYVRARTAETIELELALVEDAIAERRATARRTSAPSGRGSSSS